MSQQNDLASFESALRISPPDLPAARSALRNWLTAEAGGEIGSTLDLIKSIAEKNKTSPMVFVVLRALDVPHLLPSGGDGGFPKREFCEIAERTSSQLTGFLQVNPKDQVFKKFERYESAHAVVCGLLSPLRRKYASLESLVSARKDILGALNHGIVKIYCDVFGIAEIRAPVENLLSLLKKVHSEEASLLSDIDVARKALLSARTSIENVGGFLSDEYACTLIKNADEVLSEYIKSTRGRFNCDITTGVSPLVLQKRYPLHEPERELEFRIPLRNVGPGMACGLTISASTTSDEVAISTASLLIGEVMPGDFSVSVDALVVEPAKEIKLSLIAEWGEIGSPERKEDIFEIIIRAQNAEIDWNGRRYWSPYSTHPAEGEAFVGRRELRENLASRILRSPMESFYITGQKRVGKTSLALASLAFAKQEDENVEYLNIIWGQIASQDPSACIKSLGEEIEGFLAQFLPSSVQLTKGDYTGTLSPLTRIASTLLSLNPNKKFVVLIDEFDEIHQELYMSGNLAETFFANIRAFSGVKNICLVLVGGENMPFVMERQGQRLNRFSGINLSYFSRSTEWEDYSLLVRRPSQDVLVWHEDAINEVYNLTAGNPYFTNLVCAAVARSAVSARDADITPMEVGEAAALEVSAMEAHAFAHLWQDGIPKPVSDREPDVLRRSRALCAIARTIRAGCALTPQAIAANKGNIQIGSAELIPVLNDLSRREVLLEEGGTYRFKLPLFRKWLADVGYSRLAADSLSEELALAVSRDDEAARVQSAEIASLVARWPSFRGGHASTDDVRAWIEQVESNKDQRILFKILKSLKFLGEPEIRQRLRSSYQMVRSTLPEFVKRSLKDRRDDLIVTYLDGEGKSGQYYAAMFAEENSISVSCIASAKGLRDIYDARLASGKTVSAVVVIDDIAATGGTMAENIEHFATEHADIFKDGVKLLAVTLLATDTADRRIRQTLAKLPTIDCDFRSGQLLGSDAYAFSADNNIWASEAERDRAKALAVDLGSKIYRNNPLGIGGMGLLVVLPNTVPNNTLPILHSHGRGSQGPAWRPLFERLTN